jgi:hypothetical protein
MLRIFGRGIDSAEFIIYLFVANLTSDNPMIDRWKIDGHFTFLVRTARIPFSSPAFTRENPFSFDISPQQNTLAGIKSAARIGLFFIYTLERHVALSLGIENPSQRAC